MWARRSPIWRLVICFKCLGEAHGFSAWHALGATLIAVLIIAVPLVILGVMVAVTLGLSAV